VSTVIRTTLHPAQDEAEGSGSRVQLAKLIDARATKQPTIPRWADDERILR
jgi:hypothetical protein